MLGETGEIDGETRFGALMMTMMSLNVEHKGSVKAGRSQASLFILFSIFIHIWGRVFVFSRLHLVSVLVTMRASNQSTCVNPPKKDIALSSLFPSKSMTTTQCTSNTSHRP